MRSSTSIRARQAREILRAGRHAWKIERDLNCYVVINFAVRDGYETEAQKAFRQIRTKCRSWLYHKRHFRVVDPLTDIRTWENKLAILHVNWALHIPERLREEFEDKLPLWIEKVLGGLDQGMFAVRPVYNLNGLLRYMLKGVEKAHAHRFDIRPVAQGEVWGRRAVASTCLGRSAREKDQFNGLIARNGTVRRIDTA